MPTASDGSLILRLAVSRHEPLLRALLTQEEFRYEDLAQQTGKSDAALRTQFSRWQTLGLDLLEKLRAAEAEGKGRPVEIFRLNPARREIVEKALQRLLAEQATASLPVVDSLPQLDEIEHLLWNWYEEELDLSVRFYSAQSAEAKLKALRTFLSTTEYKSLGFEPAGSLLERIEIRIEDAHHAGDAVRQLIRNKVPEVHTGRDNFRQDLQAGQLKGYFGKIPPRSVSGFGGALLARAASADCAGLDDYLAKQFAEREAQGAKIEAGFAHVLGEIVELVSIDLGWEPPTGSMIDGASICPAVAELRAFPDSMNSYLSIIRSRQSGEAVGGRQGTCDDTPTVDEDIEQSIMAMGVAQTPRGTLYDLFDFGSLLGGLGSDDTLAVAG